MSASAKTALQLFGSTVRAYRKRLRLTQIELAARTGMDRSYIGQIERGVSNVSLHIILRLATALEIDPTQLIEPLNNRHDLYPSKK